jgi:pyruvate,water dikinase
MKPAALTEPLSDRLFGGKAAQLAVATRAGLPVPAGVALPLAFVEAVAAGDSDARYQLAQIFRTFAAPLVARSSAVGEDSEQASFAGQHLTRLNVRSAAELADAVSAIWESARLPSALAYRQRLGLPGEPRMAVVVQVLVDADSAGVLFSRNPVNGSEEFLVEAAWGLGEAVVAGIVTPDRFRMARNGAVLERAAGLKDIAIRTDPEGGTRETAVPAELVRALCLDDSQLAALHALVLHCDGAFGEGHDLEWAFADGRLYLLQRRTLTAIPSIAMEANA